MSPADVVPFASVKRCPECRTKLNALRGADGHGVEIVAVTDERGYARRGSPATRERKSPNTVWTCPRCEHCE